MSDLSTETQAAPLSLSEFRKLAIRELNQLKPPRFSRAEMRSKQEQSLDYLSFFHAQKLIILLKASIDEEEIKGLSQNSDEGGTAIPDSTVQSYDGEASVCHEDHDSSPYSEAFELLDELKKIRSKSSLIPGIIVQKAYYQTEYTPNIRDGIVGYEFLLNHYEQDSIVSRTKFVLFQTEERLDTSQQEDLLTKLELISSSSDRFDELCDIVCGEVSRRGVSLQNEDLESLYLEVMIHFNEAIAEFVCRLREGSIATKNASYKLQCIDNDFQILKSPISASSDTKTSKWVIASPNGQRLLRTRGYDQF